jgi:hypothetical protein
MFGMLCKMHKKKVEVLDTARIGTNQNLLIQRMEW